MVIKIHNLSAVNTVDVELCLQTHCYKTKIWIVFVFHSN